MVTSVAVVAVAVTIWRSMNRRKKKALADTMLGIELREAEFDNLEDGAFCNSGSWSCVPRRLMNRYIELLQLRERNSHKWAFKTEPDLIWESLEALADFVGAKMDDLTFIENTTTGTNAILKGLKYSPGDQILLCNLHTYPAVLNQAKVVVEQNPGVEIVFIDIRSPVNSKEDLITPFAKALEENPNIKIAVIDHISCGSTILFPVKEIIDLCHQYDVLSLVDGAHAAGQIPLSIEEYDADYYVGNLCKWMMVPQNVGFLWVHPKHQATFRSLATSHSDFLPTFRDRFYSAITKDRLPQVIVKDALEFHKCLGGLERISPRNSELVTKAASMLSKAWNTPELEVSPELRAPFMSMVAFPDGLDAVYQGRTRHDVAYDLILRGVHTRVCPIDGKFWCRLSCNVWNDMDDFEKLRDAVLDLIKEKTDNPGGDSMKFFIPCPPQG